MYRAIMVSKGRILQFYKLTDISVRGLTASKEFWNSHEKFINNANLESHVRSYYSLSRHSAGMRSVLNNAIYENLVNSDKITRTQNMCISKPTIRSCNVSAYCSLEGKKEQKPNHDMKRSLSENFNKEPQLSDFITQSLKNKVKEDASFDSVNSNASSVPYINTKLFHGSQRKVYFKTYGCQMNVSDTEIAWSILEQNGYSRTSDVTQADVILLMTCAIREGAESKVWNILEYFKSLKKKRQASRGSPLIIGLLDYSTAHLPKDRERVHVLSVSAGQVMAAWSKCHSVGCMAERLKHYILETNKMVDVVCGPDAYRDLPHLLFSSLTAGQSAVNVQLSLEETYADVVPVRYNSNSPSAFVSIMRGCDNMCTYCIVPFTRGRERSRPIASIVNEIKMLSDEGVKEVTLLGQNVNSYRDLSEGTSHGGMDNGNVPSLSPGFNTVYKPKLGGQRFADLLDKVSLINPEMRIRFTSPHPKDFPDEVLKLVLERPNICKLLHLPAQSGSDTMLAAMGRGYTRSAYLNLVNHIKEIIPDVALTSDFIAGFCGETEEDHQATISLIREVQYQFAFCFPYSMRPKTRAFHRLTDDVPADIKQRRADELVSAFRCEAEKINLSQIGTRQLILVEGVSKKSSEELVGRNEANTRVIFPKANLPCDWNTLDLQPIRMGDYITVQIISGTNQSLRAEPLYHTTLQDFWKKHNTITL